MTGPAVEPVVAETAAASAVSRSAPALHAQVVVSRPGFRLDTQVRLEAGEVLAVLGPNGSGKTTLLRALAGLIPINEGRIVVGDSVWDDVSTDRFLPTADRGVGVVFQEHRLFPHLSVLDNVAFSARARGRRARAARSEAAVWLEQVGLSALAGRRPRELSGGQAQRVALARALASRPRLLLLDEPMAALDTRTRLEVRAELSRHLRDFAGPTLLVTHDPLEAMVLADRIVVLEHGRSVQEGRPADVARRPATDYVARLMGLNLYAGVLADSSTHRIALDRGGSLVCAGIEACAHVRPHRRVLAVLAPSAIALHRRAPAEGSPRNVWPGVVSGLELLTDRVRVSVDATPPALVDVTPSAVSALRLTVGQQVWLTAKATEVTAYPHPSDPCDACDATRAATDVRGLPLSE